MSGTTESSFSNEPLREEDKSSPRSTVIYEAPHEDTEGSPREESLAQSSPPSTDDEDPDQQGWGARSPLLEKKQSSSRGYRGPLQEAVHKPTRSRQRIYSDPSLQPFRELLKHHWMKEEGRASPSMQNLPGIGKSEGDGQHVRITSMQQLQTRQPPTKSRPEMKSSRLTHQLGGTSFTKKNEPGSINPFEWEYYEGAPNTRQEHLDTAYSRSLEMEKNLDQAQGEYRSPKRQLTGQDSPLKKSTIRSVSDYQMNRGDSASMTHEEREEPSDTTSVASRVLNLKDAWKNRAAICSVIFGLLCLLISLVMAVVASVLVRMKTGDTREAANVGLNAFVDLSLTPIAGVFLVVGVFCTDFTGMAERAVELFNKPKVPQNPGIRLEEVQPGNLLA